MKGYSFLSLARQALGGHTGWPLVWRSPEPKKNYDVLIIGAGGHGLATAYYLAKKHSVNNVAVLDKAWLCGCNTGRNTQIPRSKYFWPPSATFFDPSLTLYERLSHQLTLRLAFLNQ